MSLRPGTPSPNEAQSACARCGYDPIESGEVDADEPVDGRYRLLRTLGRGGMGVVRLAEDVLLKRKVALKVLGAQDVDSVTTRKLLAEAAALASVQHDHVVRVHAAGFHHGAPYIAMEMVQGESLEELVAEHTSRGAHVPLHRALSLLVQIADGLAAVHAAGLVHRDVKPANVVVERGSGRAVLVDFGLAIESQDANTEGPAFGTPSYMAPETVDARNRRPPSAASDIYSLGCLAYHLLTGAPPFSAATREDLLRAHVRTPPVRASERRPDLAELDTALLRAIAKTPEDRYATAAAFAAEMESHLASGSPARAGEGPVSELIHISGNALVRVLVVDDDPVFARIAARCAQIAFAPRQIEVARARTADAAIENAAKRRPDLVILDYILPDGNGVDVLSRMRVGGLVANSYILVASGAAGAQERWRFRILGVDDFVEKPAGLDVLVPRLAEIARTRGWIPRVAEATEDQ